MTERDTSRDVAIIGMACRFADAEDVDELWENLVSATTSFGPVPEDRWTHEDFRTDRFRENDKTYVRKGAFIDDVDSFGSLHFGIAPRRVETMDPQHRMVLETSRVALQDAGVEQSDADRETMGTFLGVSTSEYRNLVTSRTMAMLMAGGKMGDAEGTGEALSSAVENIAPISAFSMPGTLLNMAAANVANQWKLGGPAFTVDAACASSLVAVHDAVTHIRAGICRTALAGGVYLNLTPESIIGFSRIGAISQKGACRPFDAEADGFLQGDGCGMVVLKSYDDAVADGDRIYAVIRGSGVNNDAGSSSGPMAPSLDGQIASVRRAYEDAGVDPKTVDFVSCHGTATPVGDPVEVGALRTVMVGDDSEHRVYLGSVKANVGHTMSAAGVAGLIHAVLALSHQTITPQAGYETPHPNLELDDAPFDIPTEPVPWKTSGHPRRAGVSAFGFGGTNCHLVVEEAPAVEQVDEPGPQTVVLSAENRELLAQHTAEIAREIEARDLCVEDVAYTLSVTRRADKARLAIVADDAEKLTKELRRAAKMLGAEQPPTSALGPNAYWGDAAAEGVAFMFPGQGAQRPGLFRDLYERYPTFAAHLDDLSAGVEETLGGSIPEFLYADDDEAELALRATEVCQPVMAAVGLALARFLGDLGVTPDVTLGHSLGEFAAAAASGVLSEADALQFVARRGRLMADLDVDDFGAMAAVMAGADEVKPHLTEGARIANLNHPQQTVISGTSAAVEQVATALSDAGVKVTTLRVSHAFHSPVVEPIVDDLVEVIDALELAEPATPLISAITGAPYGAAESTRKTWADHTTSPVDFMSALRAAAEHADVFVEVGAGTTLTAFAQGTLGEDARAVRSLGAKEPNDGLDFQRTLAMLVASGVDIDFAPLWKGRHVVSLPPAPLVRTRHWVVRDRTVSLDVPESSKRGEIVSQESTQNESPSSDLVALFREQNEILRQHAAIIAAQTSALGGSPADTAALHVDLPQAAPLQTTTDEAPASDDESEPDEPHAELAADTGTDFEAMVLDAVAGVSAFPADALESDQQLAADLGFDSLMFVDLGTDLQKRIPGLDIPQDAFDQTTTIADVVAFLEETVGEPSDVDLSVDEPTGELHRWIVDWSPVRTSALRGARFAPDGEVVVTTDGADDEATAFAETLEARGVRVRLVDLDDSSDLGGATALVHFAHRAQGWEVEQIVELRRLAAALFEAADGAPEAFVTVTSTGVDPATQGAFRGFAKALVREWPDARVAAAHVDDEEVARYLFEELDDAAWYPEVRWKDGVRQVPLPVPADDESVETAIGDDDVVLITGGAKGIGLRCAEALAETSDATLLLVGRSDASEVKDALKAIRTRSTVEYVQWDVTEAAGDALAGRRPTVIVHAAGVIRDAKVQDKSDDDVRLVTGVKVDGLLHALQAAGDDLRLVVGFGSWAGRFGNAEQTDYAAGNDAMTEVLRNLASDDCRAINVDWPIWEDSTMAESIPSSVRDAMKMRGVTFLEPDEGVEAFLGELGRSASGEVVYGRDITRREIGLHARFEASVESLPYVTDHVVRGVPLLPFASALDWMGTAAEQAGDRDGPMVLRDVKLFKGIELAEPVDIAVTADVSRRRGTAEVHADGELAYRASVAFEDAELTIPDAEGDPVTPSMDLDTFYDKHSYHGPKIRGIASIDQLAPTWIIGRVKTSTPAELLGRDTDARWTIDPLVIDATFQLVLYHLQSLHGFGAIPTSIDEYVQLRDFEPGTDVKCTLVLDEMSGGNIVGTIRFEDDEGVVAVMRRLRAKEFHLEATDDDEGAEIDPQFWQIDEFPEVKELEQRLQMAELIGIRNPYFWPHEGPARNTAVIEGKEMINYSSYNYCGFSGDPAVTKAAQDAAEKYGTSVSASRLASGQIPLHQELEDAIAEFIGTEASLVFSAGHMTNETCIGHLFGQKDLIIHDSLAHNSILTGAELSGAKRMQFPHNDWEALDRILGKIRGNYEKVGIFIEGVYSMDGDIPDLPKFIEVKRRHKALLYVDEAHSMGCVGSRGAGISDYFDLDPMEVDVWMGTLSKSFASCGGYITGSKKLIEYLKYTAPAFVFSAGISPANAGAALASVRLLGENPEIPQTLQARARFFLEACQEHGIDTGMSKDSAVVPAIVGNSIDCLKLSQRLAERGINVQPIVYPAVEDESSRLRFFLSAVHTEDELQKTADILAEELANVRSGAAAE